MDEQQVKTYEEKRAEKELGREKAKRAQLRAQQGKKVKRYVIWLAVLGAIGYGIFALVDARNPDGPDFSRAVPDQGRLHITIGSEHPPYNSNPPSSGWHYAQTTFSGWHSDPVADEFVVHNLEHGEVWIAYRPEIPAEVKDQLRQFASDRKVVITPREANETDIAVVAWNRIDTFNLEGGLPAQRIKDFITRYKNRGPENVPPATHRR